jgi:hypothetical protein
MRLSCPSMGKRMHLRSLAAVTVLVIANRLDQFFPPRGRPPSSDSVNSPSPWILIAQGDGLSLLVDTSRIDRRRQDGSTGVWLRYEYAPPLHLGKGKPAVGRFDVHGTITCPGGIVHVGTIMVYDSALTLRQQIPVLGNTEMGNNADRLMQKEASSVCRWLRDPTVAPDQLG